MSQQKVWLITGCSSGLGSQFASHILSRGDLVIATARNTSKLQFLEVAGASTLQLDIAAAEQSICTIIADAITIYGRIDVLVNNASYIQVGMIEDLTYDNYRAQFDTNFFGTIKVTQALLPHFRQRRSGSVVFISSLSGWIGHANCSAYVASKFALEGFVEALHRETIHLNIQTLLIEPGRFRTSLLSSGKMQAKASEIAEYADISREHLRHLAQDDGMQDGDPDKLVKIIVDLVRREGIAEEREVPFRLQIGRDCVDDVREKCRVTLRVLEDWQHVVTSTDIEA